MNGKPHADIVICGAGIAGVAAAYFLSLKARQRDIVLVEEGAALSLTSDKSTECYRNWWPGSDGVMCDFTNRSIDLLERMREQSGDRFVMSRRGYLFATADHERAATVRSEAQTTARLSGGSFRVHDGNTCDAYNPSADVDDASLTGADFITDPALLSSHFGYLARDTVAVLHARRCGWLSAQQLGAYMLESARARGVKFLRGRVNAVEVRDARVRGISVAASSGENVQLATDCFVNAAGPKSLDVSRMLELEPPLRFESHVKLTFSDAHGAVPRHAPLLIWLDPLHLPWDREERAVLAEQQETQSLLSAFPAGVHGRPSGAGQSLMLYWTLHETPTQPVFPQTWDPNFPEIVLRGMSVMVPALERYFSALPRPVVDGGYYAKTPDNRPLIGPVAVNGAYMNTAYSGFGIMAACAGAELLAAHIDGTPLPAYAGAFDPARFADDAYVASLKDAQSAGQL